MRADETRMSPPTDTIGGTTATMILGKSNYGGPHKAYRKLLGLDPRKETTFAMHRGIVLEAPVALRAAQMGPFADGGRQLGELWGRGVTYDPAHPSIHATIDRLVYDGRGRPVGIAEIKTYDSKWEELDWSREDYWTQIAHYSCVLSRHLRDQGKLPDDGCLTEHYLIVLQAHDADFRALVRLLDAAGPNAVAEALAGYDVQIQRARDVGMADYVSAARYEADELPRLATWYRDHIANRRLPPTDGSEDCSKSLMEARGEAPEGDGPGMLREDDEPELYGAVVEALNQRKAAADRKKDATREAKAHGEDVSRLDNELRSLLMNHAGAETAQSVVMIKHREGTRRFDSARFRHERPELWELYKRPGGPSIGVSITKAKGESNGESKEGY